MSNDDLADILKRNSVLLYELHSKVFEEFEFRKQLGKPFEIMVTFNSKFGVTQNDRVH